jgi:hypothetical protein
MGTLVRMPLRAGAEPWLSKKQLAGHYGYGVRWVELRVADGMPSPWGGGQRRFLLSGVDPWIEAWSEGRKAT